MEAGKMGAASVEPESSPTPSPYRLISTIGERDEVQPSGNG
jgi:hypothetical protein